MGTPLTIKFDEKRVAQMREVLQISTLPLQPVDAMDDDTVNLGIKLSWLKDAKGKLEAFDIGALEKDINRFPNWTVHVEDLTLHFVHQRSARLDAIPLILLHGWPGLFQDFHKIVEPLTAPDDPSKPAFHVVIPSLPGFAWSTLPRKKEFGLDDIARIYNKLMVDVLGYTRYAAQGGDWGSHILRFMGQDYSENLKLAHFNMFIAPPTDNVNRSEEEIQALERSNLFFAEGRGYAEIQSTKPATIGYAIAASPLSLLAYIGEKMLVWSDPRSVSLNDILATVAIYYLTGCFPTSVMIYNQGKKTRSKLTSPDVWGKIKSKMSYSLFPYETVHTPKQWIAKCGPLVEYYVHEKGGHFPALDNPDDLVGDVRSFVQKHWNI